MFSKHYIRIMYILEMNKLIQIIFIAISVTIAARVHQIFLPKSYSSILDFRYSKNLAKTIRSSSIRLVYLAMISMLASMYGVGKEEILIGVGIAAFLNVWPAVVQYHLLSFFNTADKVRLLFGYICFICFSILFSYISIEYIFKSLQGDSVFGIGDSKGFELLISLLLSGLAINVESVLSRFAEFECRLDLKTYRTDLEILLTQTELEESEINIYQFEIDQEARENHITRELLETILILERIYRGAWYYRGLEILLCKIGFFKRVAIRYDISVGVGQIKISTAKRLVKQNPYAFIDKMLDASFGIKLCAKYLKEIVEDYEMTFWNDSIDKSIYEYIASEYLSGTDCLEAEIVRLYAAVLEVRDKSEIYILINERKNPHIEKQLSDYIKRCEIISLDEKNYYILEPANLTIKLKNTEKNFTYLRKMEQAASGFFVQELKNRIILNVPVTGGGVHMLIENLRAGFMQHDIEAEISLPDDLTYEVIRKKFHMRAMGPQG